MEKPVKEVRKVQHQPKQIWVRKSLNMYPEVAAHLRSISKKVPFISENILINMAINKLDINNVSVDLLSPKALGDTEAEEISGVKIKEAQMEMRETKATWCEEFGGRIFGEKVHFNKYETTFAGEIVRNLRSYHIDEFPSDKEGIRKEMLGQYLSVTEAEDAYNAYQNRNNLMV